jgi:hypothetical protein
MEEASIKVFFLVRLTSKYGRMYFNFDWFFLKQGSPRWAKQTFPVFQDQNTISDLPMCYF